MTFMPIWRERRSRTSESGAEATRRVTRPPAVARTSTSDAETVAARRMASVASPPMPTVYGGACGGVQPDERRRLAGQTGFPGLQQGQLAVPHLIEGGAGRRGHGLRGRRLDGEGVHEDPVAERAVVEVGPCRKT